MNGSFRKITENFVKTESTESNLLVKYEEKHCSNTTVIAKTKNFYITGY